MSNSSALFKKILEGLKNNNISLHNSKLLLQVSGGPDSIFLFHFIKEFFPEKVEVLTLNFNLRKSSSEEFDYVRGLCLEHNWVFHGKSIENNNFGSVHVFCFRHQLFKYKRF